MNVLLGVAFICIAGSQCAIGSGQNGLGAAATHTTTLTAATLTAIVLVVVASVVKVRGIR